VTAQDNDPRVLGVSDIKLDPPSPDARERGAQHVITIGKDRWSCTCGAGADGLSSRKARVEGDHHADNVGGTIRKDAR
jgi:hypothetical protein